jgi:hypothetical protein
MERSRCRVLRQVVHDLDRSETPSVGGSVGTAIPDGETARTEQSAAEASALASMDSLFVTTAEETILKCDSHTQMHATNTTAICI